MFIIGDYFKNLGAFSQKGREERVVAVGVIRDITRAEVPLRDIEINNRTMFVRVSGAPKMEILLHKDAILAQLKEILGETSPKDIQ